MPRRSHSRQNRHLSHPTGRLRLVSLFAPAQQQSSTRSLFLCTSGALRVVGRTRRIEHCDNGVHISVFKEAGPTDFGHGLRWTSWPSDESDLCRIGEGRGPPEVSLSALTDEGNVESAVQPRKEKSRWPISALGHSNVAASCYAGLSRTSLRGVKGAEANTMRSCCLADAVRTSPACKAVTCGNWPLGS